MKKLLSGLHCYPGPWWHLDLGCCWGPCLGQWSYYSWGLFWCPLSMWTQGPLWSPKCVEVWGHAEPAPLLSHWPWESWSYPSKGELWRLGKVGPISHHGRKRAGYAPCPRRVFPAAQTGQLSFYPGTHLWAVTPQHLPDYDMMETTKRLVLQYHNHMISMSQGNSRKFWEGFWWRVSIVVYQKPWT